MNLQLSVVALPGEDDQLIEKDGARLFLEPESRIAARRQGPRREHRERPGRVYAPRTSSTSKTQPLTSRRRGRAVRGPLRRDEVSWTSKSHSHSQSAADQPTVG